MTAIEMTLPGMPLPSSVPSSPPAASSTPHSPNHSTSSSSSLGPVRVTPKGSIRTQTRSRCNSCDFSAGHRVRLPQSSTNFVIRGGPQPTRMPLGERLSEGLATPHVRRRRISIDENYETTAQFIEKMRKDLTKQL